MALILRRTESVDQKILRAGGGVRHLCRLKVDHGLGFGDGGNAFNPLQRANGKGVGNHCERLVRTPRWTFDAATFNPGMQLT